MSSWNFLYWPQVAGWTPSLSMVAHEHLPATWLQLLAHVCLYFFQTPLRKIILTFMKKGLWYGPEMDLLSPHWQWTKVKGRSPLDIVKKGDTGKWRRDGRRWALSRSGAAGTSTPRSNVYPPPSPFCTMATLIRSHTNQNSARESVYLWVE